jgi:hypothetical protein
MASATPCLKSDFIYILRQVLLSSFDCAFEVHFLVLGQVMVFRVLLLSCLTRDAVGVC